jgi:hypothetical protein
VFVGIIGCLAGAMMAASMGLIYAGIFGAIGLGALSLVFDSHARSSTHVFGAAFGGAFALVGIVAAIVVLGGAIGSVRPKQVRYGKTKTAARGAGGPSPMVAAPSMGVPSPTPVASAPTPMSLMPGLQAARRVAAGNTVDEISKLAQLHEQGGLTDEEFANAKAKLLRQL